MVFELQNKNVQVNKPSGLKAIDYGLIHTAGAAADQQFVDAGKAFSNQANEPGGGIVPPGQISDDTLSPEENLNKIVNEENIKEEEILRENIKTSFDSLPEEEIKIEDINVIEEEEEIDAPEGYKWDEKGGLVKL